MAEKVAIVSAKRTAIGEYLGMFSTLSAPELASYTIAQLLKEASFSPEEIQEVILGCVLPAGLGQAPARQAALKAGLSTAVSCTTINKMCGSGLKAIMMAHDSILAGTHQIIIAGGMENMSRAPYLIDKARSGYRMGHGRLYDHMFLDGLEDAYELGTLMGVFAERCASKYQFSREVQDQFALTSLERARAATAEGLFKKEIVPIEITQKKETKRLDTDELPQNAKPEKIPSVKPAFTENGTITAANASGISDGAASVLLMPLSQAKQRGLKPLGIIHGHASFAQAPEWFTTAPVGAMQRLLQQVDWSVDNVDLFEINEAFAVVTLAAMKELAIPHERVNVHGGACALGHPVGSTGARLVTTLLYALAQRKLRRGIASLCIGGGEAVAIAIERVEP